MKRVLVEKTIIDYKDLDELLKEHNVIMSATTFMSKLKRKNIVMMHEIILKNNEKFRYNYLVKYEYGKNITNVYDTKDRKILFYEDKFQELINLVIE